LPCDRCRTAAPAAVAAGAPRQPQRQQRERRSPAHVVAVLAVERPRVAGGALGGLVALGDRCRVAIPGGVASEPGEVGEAAGIDTPVGRDQRVHWQLVEDHEHDGSALRVGLNVGSVREGQLRDVGESRKSATDTNGAGLEHAQKRLRRPRARIDQRRGDAERNGDPEPGQRVIPLHDLQRERRHQDRYDRQVEGPTERHAHEPGQPLDPP
jgi:hypothetical protein